MQEVFELGLDSIHKVAEKICNLLPQRKIVLLTGDLGAGKTTLVKEVCRQLGITDKTSSPSFGIVNEYGEGNEKLIHIDLYRLNSIEEFWSIGGAEYLDSEYPCFIEWAELVKDYIEPETVIQVTIWQGKEADKRVFEVRWDSF